MDHGHNIDPVTAQRVRQGAGGQPMIIGEYDAENGHTPSIRHNGAFGWLAVPSGTVNRLVG